MKDYNDMSWWERLKAFFSTETLGHVHEWDRGHYWYDNPENEPDGTDGGFYYLCVGCGERKVEIYPC